MTGSERDRPGRVNPFIRCDLIEGILEDWKLAEESMGRETRVDEKDKEFIRRLFAPHEYVSLLSLSLCLLVESILCLRVNDRLVAILLVA